MKSEWKRDALSDRIDALLKMPSTDVEIENVKKGTIQRVKGVAPSQIAILNRELRETIAKTVNGFSPQEASQKEKAPPVVGKFTFIRPRNKRRSAREMATETACVGSA